jgi:poly(3-hydroxybutyrate) depolymerase
MGPWEDFLLHEMLPAIEQRFGCGGSGRRGVFGKSSGGYGAVTHALRHSDIWAAAACHSGDMGFELCYLPDTPAVLCACRHRETPSRNGGSSSKALWPFCCKRRIAS